MAAIDVGGAATDRGAGWGNGYTNIDATNPADGTGVLTSIEIWFATGVPDNADNVKVGTLSGSPNTYTSRDYESLGDNILVGGKRTFTGLNCSVVTGDFIGAYFTGVNIEGDLTGGGGLYQSTTQVDWFDAAPHTYNLYANRIASCYGIGATSGWGNIAKVNGIMATSYAKVRDTAVASIAKRRGAAV